MYPNLRYAFYDWTKIDIAALALIQTYGFVLALSFLLSGWLLYKELKRREDAGLLEGVQTEIRVGGPLSLLELILNPLIGAALGFKLVYALMNPGLFSGSEANEVIFSTAHGSYWGAAIFAALFLGWKIWEKNKELEKYPSPETISYYVMPHDRVGEIVIIAALSGVTGAKLLHLAEFATAENFWTELSSGGGLSIYGGLILGFFTLLLYAHRREIPPLQLMDALAPILLLAYGIGRLGCHLSGDGDWGDPNPTPDSRWLPDWLWAYRYPNNVVDEGLKMDFCGYPDAFGEHCFQLEQAVYPTPVWEFLMATAGFLLLWRLRSSILAHGLLFFIYLIFNGLERFLIELIRVNPDYGFLGLKLSQAQFIALGLLLIGIVGTIYFGRQQYLLRKMPTAPTDKTPED